EQWSNESLDSQTRAYIDTVIESTAAAIMRSMQQMMDQQTENQRQWNSQYMETINQMFERLEQMNISNNDTSGNRSSESSQITAERNQQGKNIQAMSRKYPSINHEAVKEIPIIQGPMRRPTKHAAQFKVSRALTANAEPYLQSVELTINAVLPRSNPLSQEEKAIMV
ncbi:23935_t:CDS:2, partial [Gigaspora rosea]